MDLSIAFVSDMQLEFAKVFPPTIPLAAYKPSPRLISPAPLPDEQCTKPPQLKWELYHRRQTVRPEQMESKFEPLCFQLYRESIRKISTQ